MCNLPKPDAVLPFMLCLWLNKAYMSMLHCLGLAACRGFEVVTSHRGSDRCCMCAGLSLRSQELTALFLGVRLFCRCKLCTMPLSPYCLIKGGH